MYKFMDYEFDCYQCDEAIEVNVELFEGPGIIPRTYTQCKKCGKKFSVQAVVDVDVNEEI